MAGGRGRFTDRGTDMRARILRAACELIREQGVRAPTLRAVAAHAAVSTGGIQFHFGNQHAFTREALRCWGRELSQELNEAAAGAVGLGRTWKLCEAWVALPDAVTVGIGASSLRSRSGDRDPVGAALLLMITEWIDETVRSLRQARLRGEVKDGVDLEAAGLDLHRLLWSHCWSQVVSGAEASAESILSAAWGQLSEIAVEPGTHLPPRPTGTSARPPPPTRIEASNGSSWVYVLGPGEPLYQAFARHELMGDPRSFLHPPEVLPEDELEAATYRAKHGLTLPEVDDTHDAAAQPLG